MMLSLVIELQGASVFIKAFPARPGLREPGGMQNMTIFDEKCCSFTDILKCSEKASTLVVATRPARTLTVDGLYPNSLIHLCNIPQLADAT
jgi:hypothetical protein